MKSERLVSKTKSPWRSTRTTQLTRHSIMRKEITRDLSSHERNVIEIEIEIWRRTVISLLESVSREDLDPVEFENFTHLREEMSHAKKEDLPALFAQINRSHSLLVRNSENAPPDLSHPYFAHMQLETDGHIRDILLGTQTFIHAKHKITIINWRTAPPREALFHVRGR